MKIGVIGTGGVGGYFGSRLAEAGHEVTFVARGAHLEAIKANGLKVESINGNISLAAPSVTDDVKQLGDKELIILAVKVWQIESILQDLKDIAHPDMVFLPLENGVSAHVILDEAIGKQALILGGLCRIFSSIGAPGVIKHTGYDPSIVLGSINGALADTANVIFKLLKEANIKVTLSDNIISDIWKKFVFISSTSAIGAITRVPMGAYREDTEVRKLLEKSLVEMISVGRANGVELDDGVFDKTMAFVDSMPYSATTSLQRDIMEGKPSEINGQVGELVHLAKRLRVEVPVNEMIYNCLMLQEVDARNRLV